ncbi:MAG TPA: murein biosynthesis integral membrane protein MurJ [Nitrospiria bacterium]|jgi:putative peptidoglycan lipid II flippase
MTEQKKITKAAGIISLGTFLSRIMGFLRDMVLARLFGAGLAADAFFVAFRIPNMLRELFAEGSMSAAFIPVFTEYLTQKSRRDAWELAGAVFTTLLTILTAITLLGILFSPWIVKGLAPGFTQYPEKTALTILLNQIMFPYLLFISLSALVMGILNSFRSFAAPALSPVMFNLSIILAAFLLSPLFSKPILGIALGVLIGGLSQFLFQLPSLHRLGFSLLFKFNPTHPGVLKIGRLILPTMIGLSVTQINILVNTLLASFLSEGSVTYLFYGMRLIHFPLGLFGVAFATALLPTMASQAAAGAINDLKVTLSFGLRLVFFVTLPAMVGLIFLRIPIVHLLFEHGQFTSEATLNTATAVLFYSVGLWAFAGVRITIPTFYSLQDTTTPVKVAVLSMIINILLNLLLMGPLAHGGLALATSLSAIVHFFILLLLLKRRLGNIELGRLFTSLLRNISSCFLIAIICGLVSGLEIWNVQGDWFEKIVLIGMALLFSTAAYLLTQRLMGSEEFFFLQDFVSEKFRKKGTSLKNKKL